MNISDEIDKEVKSMLEDNPGYSEDNWPCGFYAWISSFHIISLLKEYKQMKATLEKIADGTGETSWTDQLIAKAALGRHNGTAKRHDAE